jgi:hypothetical protein
MVMAILAAHGRDEIADSGYHRGNSLTLDRRPCRTDDQMADTEHCTREVFRRRGSPCPGWLVHAGGEAGVDFFGIERCDGFGCGEGYGRAVLVADPWHAAR